MFLTFLRVINLWVSQLKVVACNSSKTNKQANKQVAHKHKNIVFMFRELVHNMILVIGSELETYSHTNSVLGGILILKSTVGESDTQGRSQ